MSHTRVRRRHGATRLAGALLATVIGGAGVIATAGAASAEEPTPSATLRTYVASDFEAAAADLPSGLVSAVERDLGMSGAEYLASAAAAKSASEVVASLRANDVEIAGAEFDTASQSLEVFVLDEAVAAEVEALGATVTVGEPEAKDVPDSVDAYEDFKGGYGYGEVVDGQWVGRCSAGFNGYGAEGEAVVLTAGHCGPDTTADTEWAHFDVNEPFPVDNPEWPAPGAALGTGGEFQFADGHDAGLFPLTNSEWTPTPVVSTWGDGEGDPREGELTITDNVDPLVGQPICRSGATSGWTCGETLAIDQNVQVDGVPVTGFFTNACSNPGDSGGSYVSGSAAVGTLTGGSGPASQNCADWDPEQHLSLAYAVSGSTEYNSEAFYGDGWELAVKVSTPTVTAPEDGAETTPTPTFTGTVENAGPNHTVRLSIGEADYAADVEAGGAFNIPVTEALEPGEHTYSLQAGYGANSRSEKVEGSFTVSEAPEVAELTVEAPTEGQTTGNARPTFNGTGQAGAAVTLAAGEGEVGTTEVAEDGTWSITPESDLPIGVRFDAIVTQVSGEDTQEVTVAGLGITAPEITVTTPAEGSEVAGDTPFTGTSFTGAVIGLSLEGTTADENAIPAMSAQAEGLDANAEEWLGDFTIEDNGDWTFVPNEALAAGEYTLTATATLEGGDAELADSEAVVTFTVTGGDSGGDSGDAGGNEDGDDDLPDTGSNTTGLIIGGIALLAAGGAAIAIRARRNTTNA